MKLSYDIILDVVCDPSLQSEEVAAKLLQMFEDSQKKKRTKKRDSFDGEQLRAVREAMSDGRWYRLDEICHKAGYSPLSIGAISARIRELPGYERRTLGNRLYEYRLASPVIQVVTPYGR